MGLTMFASAKWTFGAFVMTAAAAAAAASFLDGAAASLAFLDMDDLKNNQFDIAIQAKPVLLKQQQQQQQQQQQAKPVLLDAEGKDRKREQVSSSEEEEDSLILSSKYGQVYQCTLPVEDSRFELAHESQDESPESVVKLLSPMKDGPCLFYTKGWWSYEFCYGREVKQYHFENGAIQGLTISLGKFESDYDWAKSEEWEASSRSSKTTKRKHHSQYYVDGDVCDLTAEPRKTEVRFKCDESLKGADTEVIFEIEEPSSCTYLFTVNTIRICSHPRFREEKVKKAAAISCSPALDEIEFKKYTDLQETTAKRVKEMGERLRNLNAKYGEKLEKKEKDAAEKLLRKNQESSSSKLSPTLEKFFKEVYSPKKLKKEVVEESEPTKGEEDDDDDDDEEDNLQEFKAEVDDLSPSESVTAKKSIAAALKGQFEEIYEEAKEELTKETGQDFHEDTDTEKAALETLTKTLNKLLDQLDKTEKQLDTTGKGLKESMEEKQEKWWRKHYESAQMENNEKEGKMKRDEEDKLTKWIKDTIKGEDAKEKSSEENLVKVRISRLSRSASKGSQPISKSQPISIDEKDEKKLSKAVQEELEKAGLLDTQGRQVEVRIVTSGFFEDEDEDGVHTLSQGDSSQFRTLLSSLLGANSQQITEEYRKSQMKSNYKFVWTGEKLEEDEDKSLGAGEGGGAGGGGAAGGGGGGAAGGGGGM